MEKSSGDRVERMTADIDAIAKVPASLARLYRLVPLEIRAGILRVATSDPANAGALRDLELSLKMKVQGVTCEPQYLDALLEQYYPEETAVLPRADFFDQILAEEVQEEVESLVSKPQILRLVHYLFSQAMTLQASDIHIEPSSTGSQIRYRVDGILHDFLFLPNKVALVVVTKLKVMADLNTSERRLPQDGSIKIFLNKRLIELRVSTLPTIFGESMVLRVLNREAVSLDLTRLGMAGTHLDRFRSFLASPHGIILLTGPTGSGKTTTLYAALVELNTVGTKIITTEDPIEYDLDGIMQIEINPEIGLTFASSLRAILRQDPDIILVGEIRDIETAKVSIQAALTGHLVFSTLHTRDAPSAIARLMDMGVEPYLIADTLIGVVAQRLIRKICVECKTDFPVGPTESLHLKEFGLISDCLFYGKGCDACGMTGFRGRVSLYEMMPISPEIREMITARQPLEQIRTAAHRTGMKMLREEGLRLVLEGITTLQEVLESTSFEKEAGSA
ncbi:MAG: type II/IV secretion system protein [Candidatus Manganitrophaceae bacterium]|nr:MAG: type II/IV secretion system protein [Candidatus Manganitrophaceae bacterium]